ncbi:MAG: DEAD/DEAH box helicase [Acidobacteria bacterium]|nr:DEAD/DEAH box helicase [Acidobacteriota bacterium]
MSTFDRLHPAVQHHVVNSLGWRDLRPLQLEAIDPLLDGAHALLVAPTAGGKTEAAVLPVLSRMLAEHWSGLSVLYLCPLRALLNNLEPRLAHYCGLVGRRVALWHGDIGSTVRRHILDDPPDLLLTTPESLEVMLVSQRVEHRPLFGDLRVVIVDEVHAFGSDDRGWHLLAVLERLRRLAGREPQRIGLSATVGNPDALLEWLAGAATGERVVVRGGAGFDAAAEVSIDFVGNDANAATVIAALHRGEKRLVFCDSRSGAETIASALRAKGTQTFVSHSSLSADERRQTEQAFAESSSCVIVATSTLELGLDIGDLDRVIQIDAPGKVASFLQRLGRTGRRAGTVRNCLFLARDTGALVRAVALRQLWADGYVERIEAPASPMHLLAQQIMALCLQERGLPAGDWPAWIGRHRGFAAMTPGERDEVIRFMLERQYLFEDGGVWSLGTEAEREFGWRHFMDLVSAFTSEGLFSVLHGELELGSVHHLTFALGREGNTVLLLGGRSWAVERVDWAARVAYVVPTDAPGKSRWLGDGVPLGFDLCRMIARVVAGRVNLPAAALTRRGRKAFEEALSEFAWNDGQGTSLRMRGDGLVEWWTFAGARANASLAASLGVAGLAAPQHDNFSIRLAADGMSQAAMAIDRLKSGATSIVLPAVTDDAIAGLKFSSCLPDHLARLVLQRRAEDSEAVGWVLKQPVATIESA